MADIYLLVALIFLAALLFRLSVTAAHRLTWQHLRLLAWHQHP
jgi:hypothetical protein